MNTSSHSLSKSRLALIMAALAIGGHADAAAPVSPTVGEARPGVFDNSIKLAPAPGQVTKVEPDKMSYAAEEIVSLSVQFKLGQVACAARLKVNGNVTGGMNVPSGIGMTEMKLSNISKYPVGTFALSVDGDPDSSLAPACKGTAKSGFLVKPVK